MRQLMYVSSKVARQIVDVADILRVSRSNNEAAGVSGLLYNDGHWFLQVPEGPDAEVTATFNRIKADPRHHAVVILSDRQVKSREFGRWTMAHRSAAETTDVFDDRLHRLLEQTSANVRGTFLGLVAARRAA